MKKILLVICFFSLKMSAQTQEALIQSSASNNIFNKYQIKINPSVTYNTNTVNAFIKQVCAAHSVTYNSTTGYFEVMTKKTLEKNIIDGKLQKNATPMADFIFSGKSAIIANATDSSISEE
ncbi:MAG: hypothetical protein HY062_01325 [Bacteroidetes bacterium]|nr:hypothetical protein [Bacteroidota bacterium]